MQICLCRKNLNIKMLPIPKLKIWAADEKLQHVQRMVCYFHCKNALICRSLPTVQLDIWSAFGDTACYEDYTVRRRLSEAWAIISIIQSSSGCIQHSFKNRETAHWGLLQHSIPLSTDLSILGKPKLTSHLKKSFGLLYIDWFMKHLFLDYIHLDRVRLYFLWTGFRYFQRSK